MTVKNFRNPKTVFLLKECFLLGQGIRRQYNPTCSRPNPPNSLSSNFPQALLATPLWPSPRGPAPSTSHFLVTALLCAASSGSDWLMCQPPTAAEFKPKPYPPAPRSSRSWVVVAPRRKNGKWGAFGVAAPHSEEIRAFPGRSSRRCSPEPSVQRAPRGPSSRPPDARVSPAAAFAPARRGSLGEALVWI